MPTTKDITSQLRRIAALAAEKAAEARDAVPDTARHRRGELVVVLDDVEERLDQLFD